MGRAFYHLLPPPLQNSKMLFFLFFIFLALLKLVNGTTTEKLCWKPLTCISYVMILKHWKFFTL